MLRPEAKRGREVHQRSYEGPERREQVTRMSVSPTGEWWTRVTLPFLLAVSLQGAGIIWWARGLQADTEKVVETQERHMQYNLRRYEETLALVAEIRRDIKENRAMFIKHISDQAKANGH